MSINFRLATNGPYVVIYIKKIIRRELLRVFKKFNASSIFIDIHRNGIRQRKGVPSNCHVFLPTAAGKCCERLLKSCWKSKGKPLRNIQRYWIASGQSLKTIVQPLGNVKKKLCPLSNVLIGWECWNIHWETRNGKNYQQLLFYFRHLQQHYY